MSITHERYKSFPAALDALANAVRPSAFAPDEYTIVLTPDRYTLETEKALFKGAGSLNTEVLTLSRLARRVLGAGKILTREGGVMLVAKAVAEVSKDLVYYKHATRYTDFAREVYDTLLQMSSSCADAAALSKTSAGMTAEKLADLAIISARYEELKADASDSPGRLKDLMSACAESALVKGAHIYAIGYKDATKLNRDVFEALAKASRSFTYYDADPPTPRSMLSVMSAPDAVAQYKRIAADIKEYVRKGGRYGDVAVIDAKGSRALPRILGEYGIKYYTESATSLFDTPPLAALYALYRLKTGSDAATASAFAKNPFSGCDREDAERLDAELTARGSDFLSADYTPDTDGAKRALERVRAACNAFRAQKTFVAAVEQAMTELGFAQNPHRLYESVTDLIEPINRLTELLRRYGSGMFESDASMFFSAARAVSVSSLPGYTDTVSVCEVGSLRMTKCKRLYVPDFNEGVLPKTVTDTGLLSDAEIAELDGAVEPTVREKNKRDREELLAVISNADEALCAYVNGGGAREAAFIYECADRIEKYDLNAELAMLKATDSAEVIARHACTESAAKEIAARGMTKHGAAVAAAVQTTSRTAPPFSPYVELTRKSLSVSELKHYFDCPYKRFLTDSIGLKEKRRAGASAADFGIIMHEFMRRWVVKEPLDASRDAVADIVNAVLDDAGMFTGESGKPDRRRIISDAADFAAVNKNIIEAGRYRPNADRLETPFGGNIALGKAKLPFVGVIDRVDHSGNDARIIDYKTGSTEFEVKRCLDGRDLQLPLYTAALRAGGEHVTGAFYVSLRPAYAADDACVSGCMVKDVNIALDYDAGLIDGERSAVMPLRLTVRDGVPTGFRGGGNKLMEQSDFDGFVSGCVATAGLAADEILSGYIEKTPTERACAWCKYGALCRDKKPRDGYEGEEDGK